MHKPNFLYNFLSESLLIVGSTFYFKCFGFRFSWKAYHISIKYFVNRSCTTKTKNAISNKKYQIQKMQIQKQILIQCILITSESFQFKYFVLNAQLLCEHSTKTNSRAINGFANDTRNGISLHTLTHHRLRDIK